MIKQLFFILKVGHKIDGFLYLKEVQEIFELTQATIDQVIEAYDSQYKLHYALVSFKQEVALNAIKVIKERILSKEYNFDVLFSPNFPCFNCNQDHSEDDECTNVRKSCGALVMDMDMTTVQIEGIDEIARRIGVFDEVAEITKEAMHGKLDFSQSLRRRVALLKNGDATTVLPEVRKIMHETEGLNTLMQYCNALKPMCGFKTCIASGGFHELIEVIDKKYGLDEIRANSLGVDENGKFTGEVVGPIIDGQAKAQLVCELKESGIPKENIIVIGDGANDLLMIGEGGLGLAYHAKPKVQEIALNVINVGNLSSIAYLLRMRANLK